jgi:uncharacterized protein YndB with AHSA1/START domain
MMMTDRFLYVTYIKTTPEKLWQALLTPEFTRQYWYGTRVETPGTKGSPWRLVAPDGRVTDDGEIAEAKPHTRLVIAWADRLTAEMESEGTSRCTFELEKQDGGVVKLTVTHEMDKSGSKFIEAVSQGWPSILSSLKSLLETGAPLPGTSEWPKDM